MPKSFPLMCPFNYPGDVSHRKTFVLFVIYNSQVWFKSSEWIICNFRTCCRYFRDKSWFTGIRKTNQSNICNKLKFQNYFTILCRFARFCISLCAVCWCSKVAVTFSPFTSLCKCNLFFIFINIKKNFPRFKIFYDFSNGNINYYIFTLSTIFKRNPACITVISFIFFFVPKI